MISLREKSIHCSTGCLAYLQTGACVQRDDTAEILEKMLTADVIVLATPVYFYSMSAQMKMLIDRTVPVYERLNNKEFYFIVTQTDPDKGAMEHTIEALRGFTDGCLTDPIERGILYGAGLQKVGEAQQSPLMRDAYEMGKQVWPVLALACGIPDRLWCGSRRTEPFCIPLIWPRRRIKK